MEGIIDKQQIIHLRKTVRRELSENDNSATGLDSKSAEWEENSGFKKRGIEKIIFCRKTSAIKSLEKLKLC